MIKYPRGTFAVVPVRYLTGLHPYEQVIYMWLCFHANEKGECFPSIPRLAEECGICATSVKTHLNGLVKKGFLIKRRRNYKDHHTTNFYRLKLSTGLSTGGQEMPHIGQETTKGRSGDDPPPGRRRPGNNNQLTIITNGKNPPGRILNNSFGERKDRLSDILDNLYSNAEKLKDE